MSPLKNGVILAILLITVSLFDCIVGGVVSNNFGIEFGAAYADAFVASLGIFFIFFHWSATLVFFALLIVYQILQGGTNEKDFLAYIGGVLVAALILTAVNFIWRTDDTKKNRGLLSSKFIE